MKINSNISALQAARNTNKANTAVQKSMQKLSSGYKINTVDDDPAGTAISSKLKAQLFGARIASRNSSDGISLIQTAEGATSEIHEMLKRMRELAIETATDTLTPDDRLKAQKEVDQLIDAINQAVDNTEFNGMKVLNGSLSNLTTVMDSVARNINHDLDVTYINSNFQAGEYTFALSALGGSNFCNEVNGTINLPITNSTVFWLNEDCITLQTGDTYQDVYNKIKDLAYLYDYNCDPSGSTPPNTFNYKLTAKEPGELPLRLQIDPPSGNVPMPTSVLGTNSTTLLTLTAAVPTGNPSYFVCKSEGDRVYVSGPNGATMQIDLKNYTGAAGTYIVKVEDKGALKLQIGANEDQRANMMIPSMSSNSLGLTKPAYENSVGGAAKLGEDVILINLKTREGSSRSINILDDAVAKVSDARATLGAYQNRLEHTVKSLDVTDENTAQSLSRMIDTDMALEMTRYTLNNVIMQSAIAMMAQANERPQQMLQLLR